jgi:hypothetical protein
MRTGQRIILAVIVSAVVVGVVLRIISGAESGETHLQPFATLAVLVVWVLAISIGVLIWRDRRKSPARPAVSYIRATAPSAPLARPRAHASRSVAAVTADPVIRSMPQPPPFNDKITTALDELIRRIQNNNSYSIVSLVSIGLIGFSVYSMWPVIKDQFQPLHWKLISQCENQVVFAKDARLTATVTPTSYANTYVVRIDVEGYGQKGFIECAQIVNDGGWISTKNTRGSPSDSPLWTSKY